MPNSAQLRSSWWTWAAAMLIDDRQAARRRRDRVVGRGHGPLRVGGRQAARAQPGERLRLVTSWTRWRSTARTAGAPGSWVTTWSVQILSTIVRGSVMRRLVLLDQGNGWQSLPEVRVSADRCWSDPPVGVGMTGNRRRAAHTSRSPLRRETGRIMTAPVQSQRMPATGPGRWAVILGVIAGATNEPLSASST